MKNRLSLFVSVVLLGASSIVCADDLSEALKNGKISGEITATYENRDFDTDAGTYYRSSDYSVGSFALKYESDEWNDISFTSKFRGYATLFEGSDTADTGTGSGDATGRFYETGNNKHVDIEELFFTYNPNDTLTIKLGRQFISSHWVNKTQDALKVDAVFGNTSLEAIWTLRQGRIYSRDHRPMTKINEDKGAYQFALTHKFNDSFSATVYDAIVPDVHDIMGAKVNAKLGAVSLGAHYAKSNDDVNSANDSSLMHFTASTTVAGFSPYAGYIIVDDEGSFPGWAGAAGETIDPMEEGDYIYAKDAKTLYLGVSKSFGKLSSTLLYGQTDYLSGTDKRKVNETTLWLGYPVMKDLQANLGYTVVNEDENSGVSDYNQVNLTLSYSF